MAPLSMPLVSWSDKVRPPGTLPDGCEVAQERESVKEPPTSSHLSWDGRGHTEMPGQRAEGPIMLGWCLALEGERALFQELFANRLLVKTLWRVKSSVFSVSLTDWEVTPQAVLAKGR